MTDQIYYHITDSNDPFYNLALEETMMKLVQPGECIMYLWQNRHTVVIGRNQNAWKECRAEELALSHGHLARRLSGGGAVYHDLGNLNFTFIARKSEYDVDRQLSVIKHALYSFGIDAHKTGRNDLEAGGRKFSGNAYYKTGDYCCHHGTLLVNADMLMLDRYLNVSKEKLNAKGVDSVRSRVVNLSDLCPGITVDALKVQLLKSFGSVYSKEPRPLPECRLNKDDIAAGKELFASWSWRFGVKIPFANQVSSRFRWGSADISYEVNGGVIVSLQIYSDGLEADFISALSGKLLGCRFERMSLDERAAAVLCENDVQQEVLDDCIGLIKSQIE